VMKMDKKYVCVYCNGDFSHPNKKLGATHNYLGVIYKYKYPTCVNCSYLLKGLEDYFDMFSTDLCENKKAIHVMFMINRDEKLKKKLLKINRRGQYTKPEIILKLIGYTQHRFIN